MLNSITSTNQLHYTIKPTRGIDCGSDTGNYLGHVQTSSPIFPFICIYKALWQLFKQNEYIKAHIYAIRSINIVILDLCRKDCSTLHAFTLQNTVCIKIYTYTLFGKRRDHVEVLKSNVMHSVCSNYLKSIRVYGCCQSSYNSISGPTEQQTNKLKLRWNKHTSLVRTYRHTVL